MQDRALNALRALNAFKAAPFNASRHLSVDDFGDLLLICGSGYDKAYVIAEKQLC